MAKMMIFVLLIIGGLVLAWWLALKTWHVIRRARDKDFQDNLEMTIKADAASERLEQAAFRARKRTGN